MGLEIYRGKSSNKCSLKPGVPVQAGPDIAGSSSAGSSSTQAEEDKDNFPVFLMVSGIAGGLLLFYIMTHCYPKPRCKRYGPTPSQRFRRGKLYEQLEHDAVTLSERPAVEKGLFAAVDGRWGQVNRDVNSVVASRTGLVASPSGKVASVSSRAPGSRIPRSVERDLKQQQA
eukprot:SAG25_NODE_521_length_7225_cov_3.656890_6_plen_172_part_00